MATMKNIYGFIDEREKGRLEASMYPRPGMEVSRLECLCNRKEQHMLPLGYIRIEVKEELKIVSNKEIIKIKTKLSAKKSNHTCIQILLALLELLLARLVFAEHVIDYLELIQATILS